MPTDKKITLQKQCILGVNTSIEGGVYLLDEEQVLYSSGNHVLIWNKHRRDQTFIHQCGKGEEIQLVTICSARKQIAVAVKSTHVGHHVLIYDAISFKRKRVIKIQNDNDESDVISLSFSQDGKQCLVLRDAPYYFLTLWNTEKSAKVVASIRLATPSGKQLRTAQLRPSTSGDPNNKDIIVCASGRGIIRFFKVVDGIFRPITVHLRREQQNYVVQRWLSNDVVLLATDNNEVIVIQNFEMKNAVKIADWKECVTTSMAVFSQGVILGADNGNLLIYNCTKDNQYLPSLAKTITNGGDDSTSKIISIDSTPTEEFFICLKITGEICSYPLCDNEHATGEPMIPCFHTSGLNGTSNITCMDVCAFKTIIATGGSDRTVRIWNYTTNTFELTSHFDTDVVSLSLHPNSLQILICCRNHVELNYIYKQELHTVWRRERQQIISCKFSNGGQYFALVCGPYVQILNTYSLESMCTLRGHSANIETLAWRQDDQEIATIGLDAVVCKWNVTNGKRILRYVDHKISSFYGGCFDEVLDVGLVNASETHEVMKLKMPTSSLEPDKRLPHDSNIKAIHNDVVITVPKDESMHGTFWMGTYQNNHSDFEMKKFHSRKVACVVMSSSHLFTASEDGTLCISTITNPYCCNQVSTSGNISKSSFKDILLSAEYLEDKENKVRCLKLEIDRLKESQRVEVEQMISLHNKNSSRLESKIDAIAKAQVQTNLENKEQVANLKSKLQNEIDSKRYKCKKEIPDLQCSKKKELETELERFHQMKRAQEKKVELLKSEMKALEDHFGERQQTMMNEMHQQIQSEIDNYDTLLHEKNDIISKHDETVRMLEEDADLELTDEMKTYEVQSIHEQKAALRLREENGISMKKYESLMKDFEEHKETIISLHEKQRDLSGTISNLQNKKSEHEQEIQEVEKEVINLDVEINSATEEINRTERTKKSQSKLINDLKMKLKPKEEEFKRLSDFGEDLDLALKRAALQNDNFRVKVEGIERKLYMVTRDFLKKSEQVAMKEDQVNRFETELNEIKKNSADFGEVKRRLIALSKELTNGNHDDVDENETKSRMVGILKKEINSKRDIMKRQERLHENRMRKLKNDQKTLETQLKEAQLDSKLIVQKQADILN